MKTNKFFYALAATAMLGLSACSSEEPVLQGANGEGNVTFTLQLPEVIGSRAYSDGLSATKLSYYVYDEDNSSANIEALNGTATFTNRETTVTLNLVSGKSYSIVFLATVNGQTHYTYTASTKDLAVTYGSAAQDETRDAFYVYEPTFKVTGAISKTVTLKRPFAQVNVGTTDWAKATAGNISLTETSMTVTGVANKINLGTGEVEGNEEVTFTSAAMPATAETFPYAAANVDRYLAMNYILVGADKSTVDVKLNTNATPAINEMVFSQVPVQRNYRTNIYGALLTNPAVYNVVIDNTYENYSNIDNEQALRKIAEMGGCVTLSNDIALTSPLTVAADMSIDLNGHKLTYTSATANEAMITNTKTLVIKDSDNNGQVSFTFTGAPDHTNAKGNYTIVNTTGGNLIIESGLIKIDKTQTGAHALYVVHNTNGAKMTVNGGKILNEKNFAVRQFGESTVIVNGGEIEGTRAIWIQAPGENTSVAPEINLTVNGGTLTGTGEVWGGERSEMAVYSYSYGNGMKNIKINVTGGTFNGDIVLTGGRSGKKVDIETLNISGGTFNGYSGDAYTYGDDELAAKTITISGGTFSNTWPLTYMEGDNGNINIKLAADDAASSMVVPAGNTVSLDLNGKKLCNKSEKSASTITNYGTLSITDSANGEGITYSYNGSLNYAIDNNGGSLVINGAKVSTLLAQSTGVVTIDAGTVTNAYVDGASKVKVKSGATATVQAKDGSAAISAAEGAYTVYSVN